MVGSHPCLERFLSEYSDFSLSSKSKLNSNVLIIKGEALYHAPLAREIAQVISEILTLNKLLHFKFKVTN